MCTWEKKRMQLLPLFNQLNFKKLQTIITLNYF